MNSANDLLKTLIAFSSIAIMSASFSVFTPFTANAQGVGINSSGNAPDPSAGIDIDFADKGTLITRMTTAQRDAIVAPALGLLLFNTTTNCFNVWLGTSWKKICGECDFSNPVPGNNGPLCEGSTLELTSTDVGNGATYQWSGPNGFVSTEQNPSVTDVTSAASGSYSVVATIEGCSSAPQNTTVTVNATPQTPVADNNGPLWCNNALNLTATTISGASYSWTGPDGFNSEIQNPTIATAEPANSGTYTVVASALGCDSEAGTTEVVIDSPVSTFTHSSPAWPGVSITFSPTTVSGVTHSWSFASGSPASSTAQNPSVTWSGTGTFDVSLTVTQNGCPSTTQGSITISNPTIMSFTNVGSTPWEAPAGVTSVEYLIVAGGGGGGYWTGGGGGAGGVLTGTITVAPGNSYPVVVGTGGSGGIHSSTSFAGDGGNSSFNSLIAYGGGGGGSYSSDLAGHSGGSGGGGNYNAAGGTGVSGQGNAGGSTTSLVGPCYPSGSGGGAGAPGANGGSGCVCLTGGNGISSSITGTPTYYGGGGAGGQDTERAGLTGTASGGLGGGGNSSTTSPGHATPNTGGGGGGGVNGANGSWTHDGGNGGSGIVILKY